MHRTTEVQEFRPRRAKVNLCFIISLSVRHAVMSLFRIFGVIRCNLSAWRAGLYRAMMTASKPQSRCHQSGRDLPSRLYTVMERSVGGRRKEERKQAVGWCKSCCNDFLTFGAQACFLSCHGKMLGWLEVSAWPVLISSMLHHKQGL